MAFEDKARSYVENLFGVSEKIAELPDDYAPDELIEVDDKEFNLVSLMSKAVDPLTGIPRNIKIPEGDFPEAKSYFDFCENYLGADTRFPFTRQMWICVHALGEYCPHCSHPRWAEVLKTPIKFDARNLPDRVQFLEYGTCPKCKRKKAQMVRDKELNLYTEVALCVSGSSRVQTSEGYLQIKDLPPTGRVQSGLSTKKYRNWVNSGVQTTVRTVTRTGHYTESTARHKHLVLGDSGFKWVKQKDLKKGDMLIHKGEFKNPVTNYHKLDLPDVETSFSRTGTARKPTHLTEDFAYLLGLWESDGHYRVGDSVLVNTNLGILAKASSCIKSVFNLDVSYSLKTTNLAGSTVAGDYVRNKDCYQIALRNTQASTWLCLVGSGKKSKNNHVPEAIWSSPDSVVLAYLAGSLDGDGNANGRGRNRGAAFTTTSQENAEGLHLLLTRLGIISFARPGAGVFIAGQYADKLVEMLKPYSVKRFTPKYESKKQQSGEFGLPADKIWELLDSSVVKVNRKLAEYTLKDGTTFSTSTWRGFRNITLISARTKFLCPLKAKSGHYDDLLNLVSKLSPSLGKSLKTMRDKNLFAAAVVRKIKQQPQEVFDIEVKKHHSFVCNGLVVHNCIGQRAGKSTMTASMSAYMLHKFLKFPKLSSVCEGIQASTPLTATFLGLRFADAYGLLWEPITKVIAESPWFCLAEGTSISLADGTTKPIESVLVGDAVKTLEGQSNVTNVFDNGIQECFNVELTTGAVLTGTAEHQVRCLGGDGKSIVWKKIGELTDEDFVLTD